MLVQSYSCFPICHRPQACPESLELLFGNKPTAWVVKPDRKKGQFGRTQQVWTVPLWIASRLDLAG